MATKTKCPKCGRPAIEMVDKAPPGESGDVVRCGNPRCAMTGAEELRTAVGALDNCTESFLDRFTAEQLLQLWRVWNECGWDICPDQWTERQVREALQGKPPLWRYTKKNLVPSYQR